MITKTSFGLNNGDKINLCRSRCPSRKQSFVKSLRIFFADTQDNFSLDSLLIARRKSNERHSEVILIYACLLIRPISKQGFQLTFNAYFITVECIHTLISRRTIINICGIDILYLILTNCEYQFLQNKRIKLRELSRDLNEHTNNLHVFVMRSRHY